MSRAERLKARRRGRWGEGLAAWWLRAKGFRRIARGMRTPVGEIDLIVRRIIRAGSWFLAGRPDLAGCDLRYDVVLVGGWSLPKHLIDAWRVEA